VFFTPTLDGGFVLANIDVTNLVNARLASEEAAMELQTLIDAMPGAVIRQRKRLDGVWVPFYISDRIFSLSGYSAEEAVSNAWLRENVDPVDFPNLLEGNEVALQGRQFVVEFRLRHKRGNWIWVRAMMRGHVDPTGRSEAICIWSDITLEHELQAQLAHARRLTQMGEVATGMAHEINQPLASISMAAENATRALGKMPNAANYLESKLKIITEQAMRAGALIDRAQMFNRTNSEPVVPVRVVAALDRAMDQISLLLHNSRVRLDKQVDDNLPVTLGRNGLLERVVANIVTNSCEAYDRQPHINATERIIRLHVRADQDCVHLMLQDSAGGIAPDLITRVFEPFFTTKPVGQGTGLGLTVVYGIIVDIGAKITVCNTGKGVEFNISLRRADGPQGVVH
jgi:PAS domain S-box-containing protein